MWIIWIDMIHIGVYVCQVNVNWMIENSCIFFSITFKINIHIGKILKSPCMAWEATFLGQYALNPRLHLSKMSIFIILWPLQVKVKGKSHKLWSCASRSYLHLVRFSDRNFCTKCQPNEFLFDFLAFIAFVEWSTFWILCFDR